MTAADSSTYYMSEHYSDGHVVYAVYVGQLQDTVLPELQHRNKKSVVS